MRPRVLTLVVTAALALTAPSPASTAPKRLPAQLGFIVFCRTSMTDVTARLGPGTLLRQDPEYVWRGWYAAAARLYLFVWSPGVDAYKRRGLSGATPVVEVELMSESYKVPRLPVKTLDPPRLSLTLLRGPNGIRLGDSKKQVLRLLGRPGDSSRLPGNVESFNYYNIYTPRSRDGCAPAGFWVEVSFTNNTLTRIYIYELS